MAFMLKINGTPHEVDVDGDTPLPVGAARRAQHDRDQVRLRPGPRELLFSTAKTDSEEVLVAVRDSGPGLAPESVDRLFESFYTTKLGGLGTTFVFRTITPVPRKPDPGHDALGLSSSDLGPSSSVLELKPKQRRKLERWRSSSIASAAKRCAELIVSAQLLRIDRPSVKTRQMEKGVTRAHDNQLSILQFGADVHAARVTCSTQLLGRRHASASKPQDAKSHNKERTATEYQLCYCRVSSLICRRRGQCAVEEDNQRTLTGKGSAIVILIRRN
jgi:hypothetical protein